MWNLVDFCDCEYPTLLQLNHRRSCSMVVRQAKCCRVVGIFILNGIILATNRKKETHFDYNAEDNTIDSWFSNFSLLRTPFTAPKTTAEPFILSKFFRLLLVN